MIIKNISKVIQEKLKSKELALSKKATEANQTNEDLELNFSDMASRTVFVRMVSNKANANFEVLEGGDLALTTDDLGKVLSTKKKFGYSQTYSKKSDGQIRGISGIKNISVEYQGGYKGIRKGIVTWTANSLDDLNRFEQHFLTNGVSVLLEWGWIYKDEKKNFKETFYKGFVEDSTPVSDAVFNNPSELILGNKGDYDAMGGVISNFNYKLNEDGGFDCTTTISSVGIDFLPANDIKKNIADNKLLNKEDGEKSPAFDNLLNCIINLNEIIVYEYLGYNNFSSGGWEKSLNEDIDNAGIDDGLRALLDIDEIFIKRKPPESTSNPPKYEVVCMKQAVSGILRYIKSPQIFVRWGWFEDNIISRYTAVESGEDGKISSLFRSVESEIDEETGQPIEKLRNIRITNSPFLLPKDIFKFFLPGNSIDLEKIVDVGDEVRKNIKIGDKLQVNLAKRGRDAYSKLLKINFDTEYEFAKVDDKYGQLRNVMINVKEIQRAFGIDVNALGSGESKALDSNIVNPPETLKQAMENLLGQFNENFYNNWNFRIVEDSYFTHTKIVDIVSSDSLKNRNYTKFEGDDVDGNNSLNAPSNKVQNLGIYQFPSFKINSIVKSQELEFKIPNAHSVISLFSSNLQEISVASDSDESTGLASLAASYNESIDNDSTFNNPKPLYESAENGHTTGNSSIDEESIPLPEPIKKGSFELDYRKSFSVQGSNQEKSEKSYWKYYSPKEESNDDENSNASKNVEEKNVANSANLESALGDKKVKSYADLAGYTYVHDGKTYDMSIKLYELKPNENAENILGNSYSVVMKEGVAPNINTRIKNIHKDNIAQHKDYLIPAELSLEVDGIGGLYPAEVMHVSYISDKYKENLILSGSDNPDDIVGPRTFFQIFNVTQTVDENGWTTSLQTKMRFNSNAFQAVALPELEEKVIEKTEDPKETVEDELGTPFIPDSSRALMSETGRNSLYYGNTTTNLGLGLTFNLERIHDSSYDPEDDFDEFEDQTIDESWNVLENYTGPTADFVIPEGPDALGSTVIPDSSRALMSEEGRNSLYYGNTTTNLSLGLQFAPFVVPKLDFTEVYPEVVVEPEPDEPGSTVIPDSSIAIMSEEGRNSLYSGNTKSNLSLSQAFELSYTKLDLNNYEDDNDQDQDVVDTKTPPKNLPDKDVYYGAVEQNKILYSIREDLRPLYFNLSSEYNNPNFVKPDDKDVKKSDLTGQRGQPLKYITEVENGEEVRKVDPKSENVPWRSVKTKDERTAFYHKYIDPKNPGTEGSKYGTMLVKDKKDISGDEKKKLIEDGYATGTAENINFRSNREIEWIKKSVKV